MTDTTHDPASPSSPQMGTVTGCDKGSDSVFQSGRGTTASPTDKPVRAAWQDIKTAPQSRGAYLVYCPDRMNTYIVVWRDEEAWGMPGWFHFGGGTNARLTEEPSHWQSPPGNPGLSGEEAIGPSSLRPAPSEPSSIPGCDLEGLERLLAKAPALPWIVVSDLPTYAIKASSRAAIVQSPNQNAWNRYGPANEWDGIRKEHADFVVAAVNSLPALIAEIRGLRAALISDSITPTADLMDFVAARLVACSDKGTGDCNLTDYVQALRREAKKQRAAVTALKAAGTSDPGDGGIAATASETQREPPSDPSLIPVLVEALEHSKTAIGCFEAHLEMTGEELGFEDTPLIDGWKSDIESALRLARGEG